jgi:hypothetical protein
MWRSERCGCCVRLITQFSAERGSSLQYTSRSSQSTDNAILEETGDSFIDADTEGNLRDGEDDTEDDTEDDIEDDIEDENVWESQFPIADICSLLLLMCEVFNSMGDRGDRGVRGDVGVRGRGSSSSSR